VLQLNGASGHLPPTLPAVADTDRVTRPLDGVTVVSLEVAVAAPLATCRLADAGARVIKVERPEGDFARGYDTAANGVSSYFAWINRGKESIVLDLRNTADHAVLLRMISSAEVFVQNLAVGSATRLGLSAEVLRARDPRLIVCDISGYGTEGPYADMKAYDLLVQAESGLLSVSGPPGPLGRVGVSVVDIGTGINAAVAISQALVRQQAHGAGAHLRVSLFDTIAEWMAVPLLHHDYLGAAPERVGLAHPSIAPYGGFPTGDEQTVLISIQSDAEWRVLCELVLQQPHLGTDGRFATNADRVNNRAETDAVVAAHTSTRTLEELTNELRSARIAFGVVNDVAKLSSHPQLRRVTVEHSLGSVAVPAPAVQADWERIGSVPGLDANGDALRREFGRSGSAC
jgi:itaconate CoA-transferase